MKNYAEEIAYLYFRLNGFFLLDNYVSHKSENEGIAHADNDILGIMPKYVKEVVGLVSIEDRHNFLSKLIGREKMLGLICEVKGGDTIVNNLKDFKIKSCVSRLGLIPEEGFAKAVMTLKEQSIFEYNEVKIVKILAYAFKNNPEITGWETISISDMLTFIKDRIERYEEKKKPWNHNQSVLLQYLLYEERVKKELAKLK